MQGRVFRTSAQNALHSSAQSPAPSLQNALGAVLHPLARESAIER